MNQEKIKCPKCGYLNMSWNSLCWKCHQILKDDKRNDRSWSLQMDYSVVNINSYDVNRWTCNFSDKV